MRKAGFLLILLFCTVCLAARIKQLPIRKTKGTAGYSIAASDSSVEARRIADYVCDGTDDQVQIQAAIDALTDGGTVFLRAGKYYISDTINQYGGILLAGESLGYSTPEQGSLIYLIANSDCDIINIIPRPGAEIAYFPSIRNLTLRMHSTQSGTNHGIYVKSNVTDVSITDVFIVSIIGGDGIYVCCNSHNIFIDRCWIEYCGRFGIWIQNVEYPVITNCVIAHTGYAGLRLAGESYSAIVDNIHFLDCERQGIEILDTSEHNLERGLFSNLIIEDCSNGNPGSYAGIYIETSRGLCYYTFSNIIFEGTELKYDVWIRKYTGAAGTVLPDYIFFNNVCSNTGKGIEVEAGCNKHGIIWDSIVDRFIDVPTADDDKIVVDANIANGGLSVADQPDIPRVLILTITDANTSITEYTITITGTDSVGRPAKEVWDFTSHGLTHTGEIGFAIVSSIVVSDLAGEDAGTDKIKIGTGNKLGLSKNIYATGDVHKYTIDGVDTAVPTVEIEGNTLDVSGSAPDGSKDYIAYFRTIPLG